MYKQSTQPSLVWLFIGLCLTSFSSYSQDSTLSFSLQEAQNYAVENSYMSKTATLNVEKSEKQVSETIGTGLPQVSATANYQQYLEVPLSLVPASAFGGPEGEFVEIFFGTEQQMGLNLRAEQLIFDGSYFVGLQAAKVYLELSKNDQAKSDIEVKNMVTIAYGNVLVSERNIEIKKKNVKNLEQSAFEVSELYKNGFVEEQDKDQSTLELANEKNALENAVRLLQINKNQLKYVLGVDINTSLTLTEDLSAVTSLSNSSTYLDKEFTVENHIDYKIISTQKEASELLWKQQKSTALPRLSGFYNFSTNAYSNEFDFLDNKRFYSGQLVGLNLNVPIFSGLSRMNRIQQAKIDVEKTQIAQKQVEQQLKIQANNAKSEYTFALSQYNTTNDNLELANRIYTKTKIKYDEGINSSLELTTATRQLLDSQGRFINAAFQLIQAKSSLDKALNQ
jgi:outer membrane protein TolC